MKISELLTEAMVRPRLEIRLGIDNAKQMLTKKCNQAINTWGMKPLFRGSRNLGPGVYLINPSKGREDPRILEINILFLWTVIHYILLIRKEAKA